MLLDGKKVKEELLQTLKKEISDIDKTLCLSVIEIGDNSANKVYLKQKEKLCNELGIIFNHIKLEENIEEKYLINLIEKLNNEDNVDGILLQLPIPKHLNYKKIKNIIEPLKDIDGLNDINQNRLINKEDCLIPCTALGIMELFKFYNIDLINKNIVIIGRSDIVGKPLYNLLINNNANVTLCHSKTLNIKEYTSNADILIVAVGIPNFIKSNDIKKDVIIIDVGINKMLDGTICGDVDYIDVKNKASYITPVPGGVGPMTILMLGYNLLKAYNLNSRR